MQIILSFGSIEVIGACIGEDKVEEGEEDEGEDGAGAVISATSVGSSTTPRFSAPASVKLAGSCSISIAATGEIIPSATINFLFLCLTIFTKAFFLEDRQQKEFAFTIQYLSYQGVLTLVYR